MNQAFLAAVAHSSHPVDSSGDTHRLERLGHAIEHCAHYLPAQGPITVFVHHNTLHAFEDLHFHKAVVKGSRIFGCQPYLSEERFRKELERGRIRTADLEAVLQDELGDSRNEKLLGFCTRGELRMALLRFPILHGSGDELRWFIMETDALTHYRSDVPATIKNHFLDETKHWIMRDVRGGKKDLATAPAGGHALDAILHQFGATSIERWSPANWEVFSLQALWVICQEAVKNVPPPPPPSNRLRHRDWLLEVTGADSDLLVDEMLIRFCAAFLDQGFSDWKLPHRDEGFYKAFFAMHKLPLTVSTGWQKQLKAELIRLEKAGLEPRESILESLDLLGVPQSEWEEYITANFLALRGWAGMIRQMEVRGDRVPYPAPAGSLEGYLAVRLILKRLAVTQLARDHFDYRGSLNELRQALTRAAEAQQTNTFDQRAFVVFQLAQILGWSPSQLQKLTPAEWNSLLQEIDAFSSLDRRRVFHEAFERRYRNQVLDALSVHARRTPARVEQPRFQTVCCIDEREESFTRHLEEVAPDVETFSMAGFFAVAMYYRGAADAHFIPQCPIVVRPQHWVIEEVAYSLEEENRMRARARRAIGKTSYRIHRGSRTFALGAIVSSGLGVLASIPLVARVLFPRMTSNIRRRFRSFVEPPPVTQLQLERSDPRPGPDKGHVGFNLTEMTAIADRVLGDLGLSSHFARIILIIGHGSNSLNNPHNSAYNCGACAGSAGSSNARALAQILNDPRVREALAAKRNIQIPRETVFIGSFHNTCNDSVSYFDLDKLPATHRDDFERIRKDINEACDRNAHERSRRFLSAPLDQSFSAARAHVENRSEDLSQTRPECGHATNAICYVGRRCRTRGLYMDRRSFLNTYDATQDDADASILTRILLAAIPVCAGINLEYYFSYIDNTGWGCGTKLPHNVASLLGVMNGASSDLRTGLPWQMVEIHEPVRLLFIIETSPQAMELVMDRNPSISQLLRNGWVQLALLDPHSETIQLFRSDTGPGTEDGKPPRGHFEIYQPESTELPAVDSSVDWYRGWRDHLGFALIRSSLPKSPRHTGLGTH